MPDDVIRKFPFDFMQCVEVTAKGSFLRVADSSFYTQKFAYHSACATAVEYKGYTNPGNGISASAWAIQRFLYNSSACVTDIQWAESSLAMNKMFDDRTTYTYA